ncbi:MAG: protein-export chaperone SecB [Alphaproteobacteria bacterium]|nr:protein-export chaperone SecB [Alphaproteobacteria bacterium]
MTEKEKQTPPTIAIRIEAQYVKDLSFEAPKMPKLLQELKQAPAINLAVQVNAVPVEDKKNQFAVDLTLKAEATLDKSPAFICELTYGAVATVEAPAEHIQPLVLIEVPHLIFPYARALLANLTREAGLPALSINPIDFASLYRQRLAEVQAKAKA